MSSPLFFSLGTTQPQVNSSGGSLTSITSKETPGLVGISFANLKLNPKGTLTPIWHPNAGKIGYCVQGKVLVTIRTPDKAETFTIKTGEIFFVPQGYVHHIENLDDGSSIINFALNSATPETMSLDKSVHTLSDSVFNSTFNTQSGFVEGLKKSKDFGLIKTLPPLKKIPNEAASTFKFDIADSPKVVDTKGGYVQLGTKKTLPLLKGLGILGFGLKPKGVVEPHWHTNAGELVYIVKGRTKITVLGPDGQVDVLEVNGGEGAFAPASHFHNIENIGSDDVEVIAFFSNDDPDYIGVGEVIGSYSTELLTAVFNTPPNYWDTFKKPEKPLVIVPI